MKTVLFLGTLFIGSAIACPQFNLKNVTCTSADGSAYKVDSMELKGSTLTVSVEGQKLAKTFPERDVDSNWITELKCDGNKIIMTETIGNVTASNVTVLDGQTSKSTGKELEADQDFSGKYINAQTVNAAELCK